MSKVIAMKLSKQKVFILHKNGCYAGSYSTLKKAQEAAIAAALEWRFEGNRLNTFNAEYNITESEVI